MAQGRLPANGEVDLAYALLPLLAVGKVLIKADCMDRRYRG